jgi:hypothetical protein
MLFNLRMTSYTLLLVSDLSLLNNSSARFHEYSHTDIFLLFEPPNLKTSKQYTPLIGSSLLPYPITTIPQCCFFACRKLIYVILIFLCKLFKFFIQTYSKLNQLPKGKSVKRVYAVNYFVLLAELPRKINTKKTFLGLSSATEHLTMAVRGEKIVGGNKLIMPKILCIFCCSLC